MGRKRRKGLPRAPKDDNNDDCSVFTSGRIFVEKVEKTTTQSTPNFQWMEHEDKDYNYHHFICGTLTGDVLFCDWHYCLTIEDIANCIRKIAVRAHPGEVSLVVSSKAIDDDADDVGLAASATGVPGPIKIWSVDKFAKRAEIPGVPGVLGMAFNHHNKSLFLVSCLDSIVVYDLGPDVKKKKKNRMSSFVPPKMLFQTKRIPSSWGEVSKRVSEDARTHGDAGWSPADENMFCVVVGSALRIFDLRILPTELILYHDRAINGVSWFLEDYMALADDLGVHIVRAEMNGFRYLHFQSLGNVVSLDLSKDLVRLAALIEDKKQPRVMHLKTKEELLKKIPMDLDPPLPKVVADDDDDNSDEDNEDEVGKEKKDIEESKVDDEEEEEKEVDDGEQYEVVDKPSRCDDEDDDVFDAAYYNRYRYNEDIYGLSMLSPRKEGWLL